MSVDKAVTKEDLLYAVEAKEVVKCDQITRIYIKEIMSEFRICPIYVQLGN